MPNMTKEIQDFFEEYEKGEHTDAGTQAKIARLYRSNPSKWSVRSLAKYLGLGRSQVARVVRKLGSSAKSEKTILHKQSEHARWKGKKLPKHIVEANHEGRNAEIATHKETSMEGPVDRALRAMGISFKKQVTVEALTGVKDAETGLVDFYIPSKKIAVEADGPRHELRDVKARNIKKDKLLHAHGIRVIRIRPPDMANLKQKLQEALRA